MSSASSCIFVIDNYTPLAYPSVGYAYGVQLGMEFIEATAFTRHLHEYLTDGEYQALQVDLANNPERGDLIQNTGGFRKVRWADPRRGKGRRGGLRVIYYYFATDQQIWLMTLYDKNEADDLSKEQRRALQGAIETELRLRAKTRKQKMIKRK